MTVVQSFHQQSVYAPNKLAAVERWHVSGGSLKSQCMDFVPNKLAAVERWHVSEGSTVFVQEQFRSRVYSDQDHVIMYTNKKAHL